MNELITLKACIQEMLRLEPVIRTFYPELALPNHVVLLLRRRAKEIALKLLEEGVELYER